MKADPKVSEGARLERQAFRAYLRRLRAVNAKHDAGSAWAQAERNVIAVALNWVLTRQKRYDRRKGGLGRSR